MGYYKDEYMIFSSYNKEKLKEVRLFLVNRVVEILMIDDLFENPWERAWSYVGDIIVPLAGGEYSLILAPDGSKEGWEVSNEMDDVRADVKRYVDEMNWRNGEPSVLDRVDLLILEIHESYVNRHIELR